SSLGMPGAPNFPGRFRIGHFRFVRVPDSDRAISAAVGQVAAVGTERNLLVWTPQLLIPQRKGFFTDYRVPHLDMLIDRSGNDAAAVRAEGDRYDCVGVSLKTVKLFSRRYVPETHGVILAGGSQALAVRAEGDFIDLIAMSAERSWLGAAVRIVQIPDFEFGSWCDVFRVSAAGRQQLAVATDGDAAYLMLESLQCPEQLAVL